MPTRYAVFVVSVLLGWALPAMAGAAPPDPEVQALIDRATAALEQKRPADALLAFREAYDRSNEKQLLYAIGVCHQQLGEREQAIAAFEQFLASDAPAEPKQAAQAAVEALKRERAAAGAPKPAEPSPVAPPTVVRVEQPGRRYAPWTWVTLGTGLALVVGGALAYGLGEADHRTVADTAGYGSGEPTQMWRQRALDLRESGDVKKTAGYALWGLGGAALASAVVLFVLEARAPAPTAPTVGAAPLAGGGLVSLQRSF